MASDEQEPKLRPKDDFYLTNEQLEETPSRKDGIDNETETTLRIYGCDLIQESGILLRLPQAVMATGQVLFHRFYCKKSFARFNVKRVAASSVWLASKLEENPRKARHILLVFHRMECRRENLPVQHIDPFSKKYSELENDLNRTERHLLKEMGFICHIKHPHKFICNYLATLETQELSQEAWNLANDSLRTTLCVRFKSEVVACGVVYAAARRFQVPLPENPPWWKAFDAEKHQIDEVCRVLAHLYHDSKSVTVGEEAIDKSASNSKSDLRTEASGERNKDRYREKDREKSHDRGRGRDSDRDREREDSDRTFRKRAPVKVRTFRKIQTSPFIP
ncbi:hypothetical protein QQ045_009785 [Rhodiola kirilowii]